jgi:hypothetical protein
MLLNWNFLSLSSSFMCFCVLRLIAYCPRNLPSQCVLVDAWQENSFFANVDPVDHNSLLFRFTSNFSSYSFLLKHFKDFYWRHFD